ncbi:low molecular weight protein-tyrosine-phosphatase [Paenibacillus sp. YYML68]|uniref:low molecular weight protein-tyrosine-phosphatase n=1 Tax=Paenibacillus sp. YYML68 TaxID=2909250 RepID=UPI0024908B05|nr:low molecular weight protein-tyrosine-phosphatase [Paenibacillus sp. YYML68]
MKRSMNERKTAVLFVCLGNICRSPMAEAVFRNVVCEAGLEDRIRIDSAGTGNWHVGKPPHEGTRDILQRNGISCDGQRARQVSVDDFKEFDYIIAMDTQNEADLRRLQGAEAGSAQLLRLLELLPARALRDVPDPYFTGNFEEVYEMVTEGCLALLERIRDDWRREG